MAYNPQNPNGQTTMANSAPVVIASNQTAVPVTQTSSASSGDDKFQLVSAASTNATVIKASAGVVTGWYIYNSNGAARKVVLHNLNTTPTAGANVFLSLVIPALSAANVSLPTGVAFSTGIAITTVTGLANNDTVAVALNDLVINIFYK